MVLIEAGHPFQHVLHFPAIGPGVHDAGAPERARYSAGKFQSRQFVFQCRRRKGGKQDAGFRTNRLTFHGNAAHPFPYSDHGSPNAIVADEQIAAVAHHEHWHLRFIAEFQYLPQFFRRSGHYKIIGRTADAHRSVTVHRFIRKDIPAADDRSKSFGEIACLYCLIFHVSPSSRLSPPSVWPAAPPALRYCRAFSAFCESGYVLMIRLKLRSAFSVLPSMRYECAR